MNDILALESAITPLQDTLPKAILEYRNDPIMEYLVVIANPS